jgi:hypothetical protein
MVLFKGNDRFHGAANVQGSKKDEERNKWHPTNLRYVHKKITEEDWRAHLSGERFIGVCPILDDNTVWFSGLDVDKIGDEESYQFDYEREMLKIKGSKFPLVVYRTKSGGLRVTVFFSEPVEADLAVKRMKQIAAHLGYGGCEVFPKTTTVNLDVGECPNWFFMPYGPTKDMFPEQCCMNEIGHAMELYESIVFAMKKRITKQQFFDLFVEEFKARANGKANGKNHPQGIWIKPDDTEPYDLSVRTMFHDGPVCLYYISLEKCPAGVQHYFLFNCCIFFLRKYPDNWDKALEWVNFNVLRPVGDTEKLQEMIQDFKKKGEQRPYEYTCKNEPICSRCHPSACKERRFGVGSGSGVDHSDWAMIIMDRNPRLFVVTVADRRIPMEAGEILNQQRYKEKCLAYGAPAPFTRKREEWERLVNKNIEEAAIVEPPEVFKTDAKELRMLEEWLAIHIISEVRAKGAEFLSGEYGESVRVRENEKRIYFKSKRLFTAVRLRRGQKEEEEITRFVGNKCMEHKPGPGARLWYRYTYSIGFDQFDEEVLHKWFNPDREDKDA